VHVECWRGTDAREVSWAAAAGFVPEAYRTSLSMGHPLRCLRVRESDQLASLDALPGPRFEIGSLALCGLHLQRREEAGTSASINKSLP
jgi:hypothetical protein